jgi:hypothetical protein
MTMKTIVPAVTFLFALSACATNGVDQAEAAASSMRNLKQALDDTPEKITAVATSLDELAKEGGDMKAEFAAFSRNVDGVLTQREHLRNLRGQVDASKMQFTEAWKTRLATITDADLRKRAEDRRDGVVKKLEALQQTAESGKTDFDNWLKSITDVRTYLESDLNPAGVKSVSDKVRSIGREASSINKYINNVVSGLDEVAQMIAVAKPATAETEKK